MLLSFRGKVVHVRCTWYGLGVALTELHVFRVIERWAWSSAMKFRMLECRDSNSQGPFCVKRGWWIKCTTEEILCDLDTYLALTLEKVYGMKDSLEIPIRSPVWVHLNFRIDIRSPALQISVTGHNQLVRHQIEKVNKLDKVSSNPRDCINFAS